MKVRKAVIPAAGLGTRMLPATKTVPKEMLPMVDKPVIQYIIEEAVAAWRPTALLPGSQMIFPSLWMPFFKSSLGAMPPTPPSGSAMWMIWL